MSDTCPEHGKPATTVCASCVRPMCAKCKPTGVTPRCSECRARKKQDGERLDVGHGHRTGSERFFFILFIALALGAFFALRACPEALPKVWWLTPPDPAQKGPPSRRP